MIMDIKQLMYFISIVEHHSFSDAAKSLFITQPTLSQTVKKLEQEFNTRLFIHDSTKKQLTTSGQLLYKEGKILVKNFEQLTQQMHQLQTTSKKSIRIGLPTLFAMEFMPLFSNYMFSHPSVELTMVQGGSYELQQKLAKGEIDLGILSFPKYESTITLEPFSNPKLGYDISVVVSKNHVLVNRSSLTFEELATQSFSTLPNQYILGQFLHSQAKKFNIHPHILYTDDNWEVVLSSVKTLNTVCLMATQYQQYYTDTELVWIPLKDKHSFFPIGLATKTTAETSPLAEELIQLLKKYDSTSNIKPNNCSNIH